MANLRVLKKQIDYCLEEVVFDCDMAICFQPSKAKDKGRISYSSVLAIIYSLLALVVIAVVYMIIDRMVFYSVD